MPQSAVNIDLKKLEDRAFERAEWAEDAIRRSPPPEKGRPFVPKPPFSVFGIALA